MKKILVIAECINKNKTSEGIGTTSFLNALGQGHFEIDTVWGSKDNQHSIVTIVDRKTGYLLMGKICRRTTKETNKCILKLMRRERNRFKSITSDNGTEFHGYKKIEEITGVLFNFCEPYHSWESELPLI